LIAAREAGTPIGDKTDGGRFEYKDITHLVAASLLRVAVFVGVTMTENRQ